MDDDALEKPNAIGEIELVALLQDQERLAVSYRSSELAEEQRLALEYYDAMPFGDEEEGRSQVVSPDVAEAVDYMTISILRTVVSGDRVVEFEAKEEGEEEAAEEATEAVNYQFMRGQDGYKVLSDWLQSGLIEKIGVVKTMARKEMKKRRERLAEVSEDVLVSLMDEPGVKVLAATQDETGAYTVEVESQREQTCYEDIPIPSEEFLFSARLRDVDDLGYKAHRVMKTKSELVEMGFDRDQVEGLAAENSRYDYDSRSTVRWADEGEISSSNLPGMETVWLLEEYVNLDMNGDGVAELVQIFRVDNTILSIERVENNPFVVFTPFPRAHRMVGNSLADKVMDIQRIRSVILRQTLDGIYLTNNPRMWLPKECETENTVDDLLTVRPGGIIRGSGAGGQPVSLSEPFDVQRGMAMLQYLAGEQESRTGITRLNQGLDADTLNKTATGTALMQAQGQQFEEFIARNFAEAMSRLFAKKLRLMIDSGDPIAVRVDGSYRSADPKEWAPDMDVSVRVGLGSGRKDQRLVYRSQLLQMQQLGLEGGLCSPKHIASNMFGWIRDASLGNPNDYWQDPEEPGYQPQQQQPDPKMIEMQAKAENEKAKLQISAGQAQAKAANDQAKIMLQAQQGAAKMQAEADKAAMQANLEIRRQEIEAQIERENQLIALAGHGMKANRNGGRLDV